MRELDPGDAWLLREDAGEGGSVKEATALNPQGRSLRKLRLREGGRVTTQVYEHGSLRIQPSPWVR